MRRLLPLSQYPHLEIARRNYFGLGKPAVAGEERFPKWGEFEAMGLGAWIRVR